MCLEGWGSIRGKHPSEGFGQLRATGRREGGTCSPTSLTETYPDYFLLKCFRNKYRKRKNFFKKNDTGRLARSFCLHRFVFRSPPGFSVPSLVGSVGVGNAATCWAFGECQLTLSVEPGPRLAGYPGFRRLLHHPAFPEEATQNKHSPTHMRTSNFDQNVPRTTVDKVEKEKVFKDFLSWALEGHFAFDTFIPQLWP